MAEKLLFFCHAVVAYSRFYYQEKRKKIIASTMIFCGFLDAEKTKLISRLLQR